jgi:hypothetical protein
VVIVDDFLANGRTAAALIEMAREAGADVLGAGFVVEKRFKQAASTSKPCTCPSPPSDEVDLLGAVGWYGAGRVLLYGFSSIWKVAGAVGSANL